MLIEVLWAIISNADLAISKWGSERVKAAWEGWLHPHWSWKTWMIGALLIAIVLLVEGSYQWHSKQEDETERELAGKQKELDEEIAKRSRPEVVPICDWKRSERSPIESNVRALILKTLTDVAALNVKVRDIELKNGTADFRAIPLLTGKCEERPYCVIGRKNTHYAMWDLYTLVQHSCEAAGFKMSEIEIPVVVDYLDTHGTKHQSVSVLRYDPFLGTGRIEDTKFRRIV